MLKNVSILLIAFGLWSNAAEAKWEIDLHTGIADVSTSKPVIEGVQVLNWDTRDQASGLEIRYVTESPVAVILGYEDLGQAESHLIIEGKQTPRSGTIVPTLTDGYTLGLSYAFWQHDVWSVTIRGGVFVWEADTHSSIFTGRASESQSGIDLFYGANLNYQISERFSAFVGYQGYTPSTGHTDQWKVGMTYHF